MSTYDVTFNTTLSVTVTIQADDEDTAADKAWEIAENYAKTIGGNYRDIRADASFDGIGADEVTEVSR